MFRLLFCFFKQKTAYEVRISDWSSDVCSSDLAASFRAASRRAARGAFWSGITTPRGSIPSSTTSAATRTAIPTRLPTGALEGAPERHGLWRFVLRRPGPGRHESERAGRERAKPGRDERARPVRASVPRSWRPPMPIPTAAPRQGAALPLFSTKAPDKVSGLFHAGTILARLLEMGRALRSEENTSELTSLMRITYAVFSLKKQ